MALGRSTWRSSSSRPPRTTRAGRCMRRARRSSACARSCGCSRASSAKRARREGAALAATARLLAGARDAEVLLDTLDALVRATRQARRPQGVARLRRGLADEHDRAMRRAIGNARDEGARARRAAGLPRARARSGTSQSTGASRSSSRGCWTSTARGASAGSAASAARATRCARCTCGANASRTSATSPKCSTGARSPAPSTRSPAAARTANAEIASRADSLGELLGQDHDLAVLAERRQGNGRRRRTRISADPPVAAEADRAAAAAQLRRQALRDGERLYARGRRRSCGACAPTQRASAPERARSADADDCQRALAPGQRAPCSSPGARPEQGQRDGGFGRERPLAGAASCELTIRQVCSAPSWSRTTTVEPKPTMPSPAPPSASTTTAPAIFSRSLAILVSRCAWSFLASWYSLFSLRSPHSRAVLMRSAISRLPSPSGRLGSALRRSGRRPSSDSLHRSRSRDYSIASRRPGHPLEIGARGAMRASRRSGRSRPARAAAAAPARRIRTRCR